MKLALGQSVRRLHGLGRERRRLLASAALALTAASAAVALLRFRTAIGFGGIPLGRRGAVTARDCVWAVETMARRLPWRTMCIEQGLAVQRLLRAAGVEATLHYGARTVQATGKLEAHVWVSVAGTIVIGGEEAPGYAEIAAFP